VIVATQYERSRAGSGEPTNDAGYEASVIRSTHPLADLSDPPPPPDSLLFAAEGRGSETSRSGTRLRPATLPSAAASFGRFEVLGRVAVGGMAEIFFARERSAGGGIRHLGLKLLKRRAQSDEDGAYFEEMFQREGRTAMLLAHPNICHVYEFGKVEDRFFISMEWIAGRSLRDVLARLAERKERLSPVLAAAIAIQVADALHYAHSVRDTHGRALDVVHRDVNPQNIMLRFDGAVQLLDFGVAYVNETQKDTRAGAVKGKIRYMAPEQLFEGGAIDRRVDVFALGICLYEMLSGTRLHKRAGMRETLKAVLTEPAPSLRGGSTAVPPALDDILQRTLQKRPEQRFQTAGELQDALETFLAQSGEVASRRRIAELIQGLFPGESDDLSPTLDASDEVMAHLAGKGPAPLEVMTTSAPPSLAPRRDFRIAAVVCALAIAAGAWLAWSTGREISAVPSARGSAQHGGASSSSSTPAPAALPGAPVRAVQASPSPPALPASSAPAAAPLDDAKAPAKPPARAGARAPGRRKSPAFLVEPGF
jgi:eukaryotic-like serine/threonine-protein kinase